MNPEQPCVLNPELDEKYQIPRVETLPQLLLARAEKWPDRVCER
jgi:hypothetical protein